jgi:anti-anti-sigma factor
MVIVHDNENGIIQIVIKGRLDADSAPQADKSIREIIGRQNMRLLFDLCELEYISSAGLRLILLVAKEVCGQGGQVVLCCSDQMVCEILQSTKLPIADSVAAGIEKLA